MRLYLLIKRCILQKVLSKLYNTKIGCAEIANNSGQYKVRNSDYPRITNQN